MQPPKICLTAAGILIHEKKVLLVKHKKLDIWLNPGGHIEENELPHLAAEREFFEETGLTVRTVSPVRGTEITEMNEQPYLTVSDKSSAFFPTPIAVNLHWISKENYLRRTESADEKYQKEKNWQRGCEQHYNFLYLVKLDGPLVLRIDPLESTGLEWFSEKEVNALSTNQNIKDEIKVAFQLNLAKAK